MHGALLITGLFFAPLVRAHAQAGHTARNLRLRTSAWALASALVAAATPLVTSAAGLGKVTVLSALGQPLRAEVEVFATREELSGLRAQLASP